MVHQNSVNSSIHLKKMKMGQETAQQLGARAALSKVKLYKRTFMSDTTSPKAR